MNKRERTRIEHIQRMQSRKNLKEIKKKLAKDDLPEEEREIYTFVLKRLEENLKKNLDSA
jgi:hypothetical protein